ncbi:MAG: hypothetical protein J0I54_00460 [Bosea sp.]|uniref:hypothetical protein n=1 Tax=unclassified Bosea (in: a-proteobacteria) TaxID=2653178 RepID=UPI0009623E19|nr:MULTISPECIES: hypothetical protein [unclassified Bosea (in: a-proteobacteria)]MBN9455075.1 hypothetical protein [Bosea sp. (in: a-proteobacteria)]OJV04736.1 MAG: hypothetical protein BGO20_16270 [Bosea sp. 67-29]
MDKFYIDPKRTRLLQASERVRKANLERIEFWGAYNLVKVLDLGRAVSQNADGEIELGGYVTLQSELSRKTPKEIETALGLRPGSLDQGCRIFRFRKTPTLNGFEVRGYSSLPDGLRLKPEHRADPHGYPRGQMAWQIVLTTPLPAILVSTLAPGQAFDPGRHPGIRYL